jgi:Carboxypeptidase regulatory-like domain
MKKILLFVFALSVCYLILGSQSFLPKSSAANDGKNNQKPSAANKQSEKDADLAETIRLLTNRSADGLFEVKDSDGGSTIDLQGRFQNVMLGKIGTDGEPVAACVTDISEANSFFGRDLETGKIVPQMKLPTTDRAKTAALHGMSEKEFEFYTKLIEESLYYKSLSPNAATINIVNNDAAGEGFSSTAAPAVLNEGGNNGTTLGAQRLNVFNFAGSIWGAFLDSSVPVNVRSNFDPLTPCTTSGGVLGSAGTLNVHRNFVNAGFANTWYHAALANKTVGADLSTANPEISATFNSDVDTGCLGVGTRFYYGLNNSTPSGTINLLVVVLHEMGHGLGFSSFVNGSTGALFNGSPDVYTQYMYDVSTSKYWAAMTDAERQASALNTNNVYWDGASVKLASGSLTAGRDAATGRVQLFTPNPFQSGSSISHFNTAASPNLLMEPVINTGLPTTLDLTRQQMRDIGWYRDSTADNVADTITNVQVSNSLVIGNNATISWTNNGSFNRNVTIELSTNGGATYPTTIASNVANTGSYNWTVPNSPTTQGRIRVREFDFAAPLGATASNFAITVLTSASASVSGRVLSAEGTAISRAIVSITDENGFTQTARTNSFGYFNFAEVASGGTYVINARHGRYQFQAQTLSVNESLEMNLTALP